MKLFLNLFALWQSLPTVLRHFKVIPYETQRVDDNGNAWSDTGPNRGTEPTHQKIFPKQEEIILAFAGTGWSLWSLLRS